MFRPVVVSQSTGGLPVWTTVVWSGGATEGAGTTCRRDRRSRFDSSDSTQRPLCFVTQCGIVCGRLQRLSSRLRLRSDASQGSGGEDSHIEEFILQSFDQLRHCRLRSRTNACERLTRRPSNAGNGIAQGSCQDVCRTGRARADGRQGLRRVNADVWILVRKRARRARRPKGWHACPTRPGRVRHRPRPSNPRLSAPASTPAESFLYAVPGRSIH